MQSQVLKDFSVLFCTSFKHAEYIPPYDISKSAKNNKRGGDDIDKRICRVVAKAVFRYDINPRVAKCRNGVEYGNPYPFRSEIGNKYEHIQHFKKGFGGELIECYMFKTVLRKIKFNFFKILYTLKTKTHLTDAIDDEFKKWEKIN